MPGIGRVYAAVIVSEVGDVGRFRSADALASYASVAPQAEQSGRSSRARKRKGGNRRLKAAMISAARSASLHDARSRAYYERKRGEGKSDMQAIRALARRRVDLIFALLKSGKPYSFEERSSKRVVLAAPMSA